MKELIILGSTGSIGTQTLDIVRAYPDRFAVIGISCGSNIELFNKQIAEFKPKYIYVADTEKISKCVYDKAVTTLLPSMSELVSVKEGDIVVTAIVGVCGLLPTLTAIENGKDIALANKETLVAGGDIVMKLAKQKNVLILPVDSEHSAIWQASDFGKAKNISRLILTASGGAFRDKSFEELKSVKWQDALKHPTWNMGTKVTIDSATLMNKGLEIIEAKHLFGMEIDKIDVVIHKESIIHSLVAYDDSSVIAQLSNPDMKLPIQLALTYPERVASDVKPLDLADIASLSFERPNTQLFKCLDIARYCGISGGIMPAIMNSANEIAVKLFIDNKISFVQIPEVIERELSKYSNKHDYVLEDILQIDTEVKEKLVREYY